jgi:hemoglobin-like flavoprotein
MTAASLDRLQRSFDTLGPKMEHVTALFYERLFAIAPDTQTLFKVNMEMQRRHMSAALAMLVRNMRMLDAFEQPLQELGARHARVGVLAAHYPPVIEAMTFALADALGSDWTPDVAADWTEMLSRVANHMLAGANANDL